MTIVTSKNHRNQNLKDLIKKVNFQDVIVMGSIGCKISSILRGESDVYISLSSVKVPQKIGFCCPRSNTKASGGAMQI